MEFINEIHANSNKLEVEIGEGRVLDEALLAKIKEIALSSIDYHSGEKDFFLSVLNKGKYDELEDWQLVKFVRVAEKNNVKIKLLGKPHLNVESTRESQERLIALLKVCYLQDNCTKLRNILEEDDEKEPDDISEADINLVMVVNKTAKADNNPKEEKKQNPQDEYEQDEEGMLSLYQKERKFSSFEQIYGKKEIYPLSQLMKSNKKPENKHDSIRVLIEGWAGMGKTVLCQYLSVMWGRNVKERGIRWWLEDIQIVLWIRLRNLAHYDPKNCCIGEVVRRECFGVKDSKDTNYPSAVQIEADLEALGNKVVFLLDGFDEVAEWYQEYQEGSYQTLSARSELLKDNLIGRRHRHHVILMSRPGPIGRIDCEFDRYLEMGGFQDKDIERYIQKYFKTEPPRGEALLTNMRRNTNLWGIAHVPVNVAMICLWWKENNKSQGEDKEVNIPLRMTMTELYSEAILSLLRRDWLKCPVDDKGKSIKYEHSDEKALSIDARDIGIQEFEEELDQYPMKLRFLRDVAWCAQTSSQYNLFIPGEKVVAILKQHYPTLKRNSDYLEKLTEMKLFGLLESQQELHKIAVSKNQFYFLHLTFQEYFAAKYWVGMYCSEIEDEKKEAGRLFIQYKYHTQFEIVWWFTAGLLRTKSKRLLEEFFILLNIKSRELVGVRHVTLLMRCLEESQDYQLINKMSNQISSYLKDSWGAMSVFYTEVLSLKYTEDMYKILCLCPTLYKLVFFKRFIIERIKKEKDYVLLFKYNTDLFEVLSIVKAIGLINEYVESLILFILNTYIKNPEIFSDTDDGMLFTDPDIHWFNMNIVSNNFIDNILKLFYEHFEIARAKNDLNKCIYFIKNINKIPFGRVKAYDINAYNDCVIYILENYTEDYTLKILEAFEGRILSDLPDEISDRLYEMMLTALDGENLEILFDLLSIVSKTEIFYSDPDIQKKCIAILKKHFIDSDEKKNEDIFEYINKYLKLFDKENQVDLCIILAENIIPLMAENYEDEIIKIYIEYLCTKVLKNNDSKYESELKGIGIIASLPKEFVSDHILELCLNRLKTWFNKNTNRDYNKWLHYGSMLLNVVQFDDIQRLYMFVLKKMMDLNFAKQSEILDIVKYLPEQILNIEFVEDILSMLLILLQHETSNELKIEIISCISRLLSDRISNKVKRSCTTELVNIVERQEESKLYIQSILIAIDSKLLLSNQKRRVYLIALLNFVSISNQDFRDDRFEKLPYHLIDKLKSQEFISTFLEKYFFEKYGDGYLCILKGLLEGYHNIEVIYQIASYFMSLEKNPKKRLDLLRLIQDSLFVDAIKKHNSDIQIPAYVMFAWYCINFNRIVILDSNREHLRYQNDNGDHILIHNKVLVLVINMVFESVRKKFNLPPSFETDRKKSIFFEKSKSTNDLLTCVSRDTFTINFDSTHYNISFHEELGTDSLDLYINCVEKDDKTLGVVENMASFLKYKCVNKDVEIQADKSKISLLAKNEDIRWIKMNIMKWLKNDFTEYLDLYIEKTNFQPFCSIL